MRPFFLPMNALIIAHYSNDLNDLLDEVAVAASAIGAQLILGDVTERSIADKTRGKKFDLVIFTGHGAEEGYALCDGVLSPDAIGAYIRRWGAEYLILNCCCSWRWVPDIQRQNEIGIIAANTDELDDRDAWRAMEDILHGLKGGGTLRESADPSSVHSYWGAKGSKEEGRAAMTEYDQYIRDLERTLAQLRLDMTTKNADTDSRLKEIEGEIRSIKNQQKVVIADIASARKDIESVSQKIDYRQGRPLPDWKVNILIAAVVIGFATLSWTIYLLSLGVHNVKP